MNNYAFWSNCSDTISILHYYTYIITISTVGGDPQGALARQVPQSAISAANTEANRMQIAAAQEPTPKAAKRESYAKFTNGQKAEIAK